MSWFVKPAIVRLDLPDGQWIEVKRELSYGETQDMYSRMRRQFGPNEVPMLDSTLVGIVRMESYILHWSLTEDDGEPVPVSPGAFRQLQEDRAKVIRDALDAHDERVRVTREAEKKTPTGAPAFSPMLRSAK